MREAVAAATKKDVESKKSGASKSDTDKKKERRKPKPSQHTNFKREVRRLQTGGQSLNLLSQRAPLVRLVREILREQGKGEFKLGKSAVDVLHPVAEDFVRTLLMHSNSLAIRAGRKALFAGDVAHMAKIIFNAEQLQSAVLPFDTMPRIRPESADKPVVVKASAESSH